MLKIILLCMGFALFLLGSSASGGTVVSGGTVRFYRRFNLVSLGLACWILAEIIGNWNPKLG